MKKKIAIIILSILTIIVGAFGITACNTGNNEQGDDNVYTQGLEYTLNEAKTSYVVTGIGTATGKDIVIADSYNGLPVTSIGYRAFYDCGSLTSVTIPDSVKSIGEEAFGGCGSLTNIILHDSVTSIGEYAFLDTAYYNDDNNWEYGVLYIGKHLLNAKTSITEEYQIKAGTLTIADGAFGGYVYLNLNSLTIPDSVTSIGDNAFRGCSNTTSIVIGSGVTSIGGSAFCNCEALTDITIPDSVTSVGERAFENCSSLTSVIIGNGVTSIGDATFIRCSNLKSVTIGNSVTSIGGWAFQSCDSLESITIPDSVKSIGNNAFGLCDSLTNVIIGNGVTSIGDVAFGDCPNLKNVTIGNSVTSIGGWVFMDCSSLTSITFNGTLEQWKAIDKDSDWNYNTGNYTVTCTDGKFDRNGNKIAAQ